MIQNKFAYIGNKIKNGMIYSYAFGFSLGFVPNDISIKFNEKKIPKIPLPLITGFIGLMSFVSCPFTIGNYLYGGVYFDKLFDKYDINVKRYHQHDGNDNKYAFPSLLQIDIKLSQNKLEFEQDL